MVSFMRPRLVRAWYCLMVCSSGWASTRFRVLMALPVKFPTAHKTFSTDSEETAGSSRRSSNIESRLLSAAASSVFEFPRHTFDMILVS